MHQLHVDADLLAKVEVLVNYLDQLLQHVICEWSFGAVNGHFHHFVQCEFINAFVVAAAGCPEDGISDIADNQLGDGPDHTLFSADDQLIDEVQSVRFLLCLCLCSDRGEDCFARMLLLACQLFSLLLDDGASHDCICRFTQCEQIIAIAEKLLHALAWVARVKLADEHTPNAFLQ